MLTGKCKEDFDNWLETQDYDECNISDDYSFQPNYIGDFDNLPFSMQLGVYIDFFDSFDIVIELQQYQDLGQASPEWAVKIEREWFGNMKTRGEARKRAMEMANELYNSKFE